MGFTGPEKPLVEALELPLDARGMLETTEGDSMGRGGFRTRLPTVFAAGDIRRGPSLVVWAIVEGMRAAGECHSYLMALDG
jgi:NADPH-dependent glutamate synthase beta subunit-like oxidoreductase